MSYHDLSMYKEIHFTKSFHDKHSIHDKKFSIPECESSLSTHRNSEHTVSNSPYSHKAIINHMIHRFLNRAQQQINDASFPVCEQPSAAKKAEQEAGPDPIIHITATVTDLA